MRFSSLPTRLVVLVVASLAISGCATTKHVGNFNFYPRHTDVKTSFIILKDGKKITGSQVNWSTSPGYSSYVAIDGRRFLYSEVLAVSQGGLYFLQHRNAFLKRIVRGDKLNVYSSISRTSIVEGNYQSPGHTYIVCWLQRGTDGELFRYAGNRQLAEEVRSCPEAFAMANKSSADIRKLTRDDPDYLNKIVDLYNNNCSKLPDDRR